MVVTFDKEYLQELFEQGRTTDKKHRFQPDVIKLYVRRIQMLQKAVNTEELYQIKALNYEVLKGDKKEISSIMVNLKYRIEFTVNETTVEPIITVCNILDLTNHYQ